MKSALTLALSVSAITAASSLGAATATDADIAAQRAALAEATKDAGFGPQSPRDLSTLEGENDRVFATAPAHTEMNLCNIHFHENAEHRGGQFTTYAGNGDGEGAGTGFRYDGTLTEAELAPYETTVGPTKYGDLQPGDTIEVHYVHTTAQVQPGPTLGSCLSEAIANPQLRVEAQVFVLVNDDSALDFTALTAHEVVDGLHQAPAIPTDTGTPILYPGSTTGPSFNTAGSPLQVTWSVRPDVAKVSISSVEAWLADNAFDETGAHGVRNLVTNPALLAPITQTGG
ncbi:delta-class carbonic anhydrase [uncultured Roseobacter sp.]|uniref:delta-class carbonic anhydrase n=1 Tax=uncultured Roseobacter sp. TaxID=114847 RepID=UPI0026113E1F|nr:delta-class carbonic anhydrase [uncultured Roseobacter sp.]